MRADEKAKELVDRFYNDIISQYEESEESYNNAKQCALICVDVILNDVGAKDWENDEMTGNNYWEEVKREIK